MLLLILINFFFESIDIPPKDIFDGLPSLFFMLLIIVANSILLKFLALTLLSTSCVISKTNTIELQTLIVFTFAPRTRNNRIILPLLLLEQLILSNGFAHNFLSHFLDSLFFFFLLERTNEQTSKQIQIITQNISSSYRISRTVSVPPRALL